MGSQLRRRRVNMARPLQTDGTDALRGLASLEIPLSAPDCAPRDGRDLSSSRACKTVESIGTEEAAHARLHHTNHPPCLFAQAEAAVHHAVGALQEAEAVLEALAGSANATQRLLGSARLEVGNMTRPADEPRQEPEARDVANATFAALEKDAGARGRLQP